MINKLWTLLTIITIANLFSPQPCLAYSQTLTRHQVLQGTKTQPLILTPSRDLQNITTAKSNYYYDIDFSDLLSKLKTYRLVYGLGQVGFTYFYYKVNNL